MDKDCQEGSLDVVSKVEAGFDLENDNNLENDSNSVTGIFYLLEQV